jgi:hypothetical protein
MIGRPAAVGGRNQKTMRFWAKIAAFLVCGYGLFGKSFAYLGVPPAKLFIGDIALVLFMICCTGAILRPFLDGLLRPTQFSGLFWGLILFVFYGFVELARGLAMGYAPIPALQDVVVNVYPFYFFVGLWAAVTYRNLVRQTILFSAWASCFYALVYFLFLRNINILIPGSNIPAFLAPGGGLILLGITYFDNKEIRQLWFPIVGNLFIILAGQVRAGWLSMGAALVLQSVLTGKIRRLVSTVGLVTALLAIGFITDVSIPSPAGRGLNFVSSREIVARAVGALDRDAAVEISRKNGDFYAGTVSWRQRWWNVIWSSAHTDAETALLGHGYGYPLSQLVPYLKGLDIRTPHNIFFYALGYTGWIGVVLFFTFQGMVAATMFRVWQVNGQPFGIVFWLAAVIGAFFGDFFEAPQGAIPFYLTIGMVAADLVSPRVPSEQTVIPESRQPVALRQIGRLGFRSA